MSAPELPIQCGILSVDRFPGSVGAARLKLRAHLLDRPHEQLLKVHRGTFPCESMTFPE